MNLGIDMCCRGPVLFLMLCYVILCGERRAASPSSFETRVALSNVMLCDLMWRADVVNTTGRASNGIPTDAM